MRQGATPEREGQQGQTSQRGWTDGCHGYNRNWSYSALRGWTGTGNTAETGSTGHTGSPGETGSSGWTGNTGQTGSPG